MKTIDVSNTILEKKPYFEGFESTIYKEDDMLYKIFKTNDKNILINKRNKLELLSCLNLKSRPIDLIDIDGKFKGYVLRDKTIDGYKTLYNIEFKRKDKIEILKKIKNELNILHQYNIIYGDINEKNILIKDDDVCFCDLDNTKINDFDFDVLNLNEKRYLKKFEADKYLDTYTFNLLTISYLKHIFEPATIDYLRKNYLPFILNNKENWSIVDAMINLDNKENIKPFIDNLHYLTKKRH